MEHNQAQLMRFLYVFFFVCVCVCVLPYGVIEKVRP